MRKRRRASARDSAPSKASAKKIVVDFPAALYAETEAAVQGLATNRSSFVRQAVAFYLDEIRRKKLEQALIEGYLANADSARRIAEEFMNAEADLA